jgi:hypothetical protein
MQEVTQAVDYKVLNNRYRKEVLWVEMSVLPLILVALAIIHQEIAGEGVKRRHL